MGVGVSTRARVLARRLSSAGRFEPLPEGRALTSAEVVPSAPALYEPEQLSRVTACGFKTTLEFQVNRLNETSWTESPLFEYRLGPCVIAGGTVFSESAMHFFSDSSWLRAIRSEMQEYDRLHLANMQQGLQYFGHWLQDDCNIYQYLVETGGEIGSLAVPDWPDRRIYEPAFAQDWTEITFARVQDLVVYREIGFNLDKKRRMQLLRERLRASHPGLRKGGIVYVSRGSMGSARDMIEREAFEAALAEAGIRIAVPGGDPQEFVQTLLDADIIVAIEGSQACHAVYMLKNSGGLLILQPPNRFYNPHFEWTRLLGMQYGTVVGIPEGDRYRIEPGEVFAMLDRLDKAVAVARVGIQ